MFKASYTKNLYSCLFNRIELVIKSMYPKHIMRVGKEKKLAEITG